MANSVESDETAHYEPLLLPRADCSASWLSLIPIRGRVHFIQLDHLLLIVINSSVIYKLRNFNKAKLVAKRRKGENCNIFAKSRTYRAIDAWQEYSLTIYKFTDT